MGSAKITAIGIFIELLLESMSWHADLLVSISKAKCVYLKLYVSPYNNLIAVMDAPFLYVSYLVLRFLLEVDGNTISNHLSS